MKRLFVITFILILLTACSSKEPKEADREMENIKSGHSSEEKVEEREVAEEVVSINHSGNILAGGKYVLLDDTIYFANMQDQDHLYKMNIDGTNVVKLLNVPVKDLHIFGEWLYYLEVDYSDFYPLHLSLNKIKLDGSEQKTIVDQTVGDVFATEDHLIFTMEGDVYSLAVEKDDLTKLPYFALTMSVSEGKIVFYNYDGYHLGDIHGSDAKPLFVESAGDYILDGDDLYYTVPYLKTGLFKYSLETSETVHIIKEEIDYFNVQGDEIYYSTAESEASRSIYLFNQKEQQTYDLNTVISTINIFDDYVIGEYRRQGPGWFTFINRETKEISEISNF